MDHAELSAAPKAIDPHFITDMAIAVVVSYVGNNPMPAAEVPAFIASVHGAVSSCVRAPEPVVASPQQTPAVNPRKSITDDYLVCLEDGKKFKSLKRHLMTHYGLTPDEYRQKWGLPADYPMVAPNYAAARSELAKKMGLGRK